MRILHVIPSLQKGGAERLCLDIVRALRKQPDVECAEVAILNDINEYKDEYPDIKPIVIKSHVIPSISGRWDIDVEDWKSLLGSFRPEVIHSHLFLSDFLTRFQIKDGIKYVSHCHDNMHQLTPFRIGEIFDKKRLTEWYERRFLIGRYKKSKNVFIAVSRDTESYFKQILPSSLRNNVYLLPNAIDTNLFAKQSKDYTQNEKIQLINVGSFLSNKNQLFLVDVMKELLARNLPVKLVLAGDGPLLKKVQDAAIDAGVAGQIHFMGKVSNIENLLWESQIYVHSALHESFGLVLVEAMAAGLPVVCLDAKGNRGLIDEGRNGYILSEPDATLFAEKIASIALHPSTRERMGQAAKEKASEYDIIPYVKRLLEIYTLTVETKNGQTP